MDNGAKPLSEEEIEGLRLEGVKLLANTITRDFSDKISVLLGQLSLAEASGEFPDLVLFETTLRALGKRLRLYRDISKLEIDDSLPNFKRLIIPE